MPKITDWQLQALNSIFIVDPDQIRKVKYISLVESSLMKDVISNALTTYIETWETKNGKIRLPKKQQKLL